MASFRLTCITPKPGPFPAGRRCSKRGCITVLNRWHEGPLCYQHSEPEEATWYEQRISFEDLMSEVAA